MNDDSHGDIFGDSFAAADVAAIDAIMDGAERKKENKATGENSRSIAVPCHVSYRNG